VWGLWHGLGLFAHKVWSDRTRAAYLDLKNRPGRLRLWTWVGVVLTFHFVALGWVWFALPDVTQAAAVIGRLFGVGW
jgi:alginate O-acetyltransferase complex protein AlgI